MLGSRRAVARAAGRFSVVALRTRELGGSLAVLSAVGSALERELRRDIISKT